MKNTQKIGIIILAAGASTRMGSPKQLLNYQGENLVNRTIKKAIASVCDPVILVLGANAENIRHQIHESKITIIENQDWNLGMSASLKCGITEINTNYPHLEAVIITVCDQPFLEVEIINKLVISYQETNKPIIACEYADTLGVPVLFSKKYFQKLANLTQDMGARKLIKTYKSDVFSIPFPLGKIDIDTPQDYQQLLEK
ncbi:MAG: nucleotidyltransferase family protein [Nostocales cyanobacterium]|nr:MAG: nucleotidyltransferase family protein [Nostocales cyanobacterium]TAF19032.1 MAG: nucleotidyltransferase family protein [Nostocales cyanobacterium]